MSSPTKDKQMSEEDTSSTKEGTPKEKKTVSFKNITDEKDEEGAHGYHLKYFSEDDSSSTNPKTTTEEPIHSSGSESPEVTGENYERTAENYLKYIDELSIQIKKRKNKPENTKNIFQAAKIGCLRSFLYHYLIDNNALEEAHGPSWNTPMHIAARYNQVNIIELIKYKGGSIDPVNKRGYTPLMVATYFGKKHSINYLLNHGADINKTNKDQNTAIYSAVVNGHKDIVRLLIERNANLFHVNNDGLTPLGYAEKYTWDDVIEILEPFYKKKKQRK